MKKNKYKICSEVWLYPSAVSAWHFVSIDKKESKEIKENFGNKKRGFGSIRVEASVGRTKWNTSIFPHKKSLEYILPLKSVVRRKEGIFAGDNLTFFIKILV